MSTFAVFGMTHHFAYEEAKKKAGLTDEIDLYIDRLFDSKRKVRLSVMFDSPEMASDLISTIKKTEKRYRDLSIRAQVRIKNPEGSKRAYKTKWIDDWKNFNMEKGV